MCRFFALSENIKEKFVTIPYFSLLIAKPRVNPQRTIPYL